MATLEYRLTSKLREKNFVNGPKLELSVNLTDKEELAQGRKRIIIQARINFIVTNLFYILSWDSNPNLKLYR